MRFFFGGIFGGIGLPAFEFARISERLHGSQVFVRDLEQAWYQRGLPGVGPTLADIDSFIASTIDELGAKDVRFVGNSMGGFAALLFCARAGVGRAVTFAPQTFIDPELRAAHGDERWPAEIDRLHRSLRGDEILDLGTYLREEHPDVNADVYLGVDDPLDVVHAGHLHGLPNVVVHRLDVGGHSIVRKLREDGRLVAIIDA